MSKTTLMQGSEALVRGAIYAGVKFFAGYPITPATEIAESMAKLLPRNGGIYFQGEDELASINAIIGASWDGVKTMTATSGPGFSLMQEGIGYAVSTETPIVVVDVQRGGPSTGQPTISSQQDIMQARYGSHGDYEIVVLTASSVEEMFTSCVTAVNISEMYRTPVILLVDEILAHIWEKTKIFVPDELEIKERKMASGDPKNYKTFLPDDDLIPPAAKLGEGYNVLVEGQLHDEAGFGAGNSTKKSGELVSRLIRKIRSNEEKLTILDHEGIEDDTKCVILSYGSVSRSSYDAFRILRDKGVKVGFIKLTTLWPFPEIVLSRLLSGVETVFVPEMNSGKYSGVVKSLGLDAVSISSLGGEMPTPKYISEYVEERLKL